MAEGFTRTDMLPALPPPISQSGVVRWLRENLLSTPFNIALTALALVLVALVAWNLFPWFWNSVWNAGSLAECRAIVAASAGEGASGACWAFLKPWWGAYIFGHQYPVDGRWRPILALGLLFVAIAPVLFAGQKRRLRTILGVVAAYLVVTLYLASAPGLVFALALLGVAALFAVSQLRPGKLLWFTLAYPALCFWLLWGGSVWTPIIAMAGFGLLYAVFRLASPYIGLAPAAGAGFVVAVLWWLFVQGWLTGVLHAAIPVELLYVPSDKFGGFLLAIVIGVTGITFSLPIGVLLALGRQSDMPIVKTLCVVFIEALRGVPLITLLFVAKFVLGFFLPSGVVFDDLLRVLILVTFFSAAYLAEVLRGSLAALPRGQYEAADALGLDYWRAQRLIILPQALKISIPAIVSSFIGLFKDTTLVTVIALYEPLKGITHLVRQDVAWKGIYWEPYIFVGAIFFVFCFSMSRYSKYLERKLKTDHR
jgi:general L-amino acid transport system permease protein